MIRRFLRSVGTALLVAGIALVLDAGLTVVWQEPFSAAYAHFVQGGLNGELDDLAEDGPDRADLDALAALTEREQKVAYLARSVRRKVPKGQSVVRISIPKLKLGRAVVDGTDTASLRKGPGVIETTDLPGLGGTTAIAGHRTTYGAPFHNVNRLGKGDKIFIGTPYGRFEYAVTRYRIVKPSDVWVLERIGRERLVLSACHPLYSAAQRIVVFAELVGYRPPSKGPWAKALAPTTGSLAATPSG